MNRKEAKTEFYKIQRILESPLMTNRIRERLEERQMKLLEIIEI